MGWAAGRFKNGKLMEAGTRMGWTGMDGRWSHCKGMRTPSLLACNVRPHDDDRLYDLWRQNDDVRVACSCHFLLIDELMSQKILPGVWTTPKYDGESISCARRP
jgi:hypothetical protein